MKRENMKREKICFIIALAIFLFSIISFTVSAADTGFDSGLYDTGSEDFSEENIDELTSEEIAEYINYIDDITLLDQYEFNKYVETYYGTSVLLDQAVPGATLDSSGFLVNGQSGSRVNLKNLPLDSLVSLEKDGSITIYGGTSSEELDVETLWEENEEGNGPALSVISSDGDIQFADGTILLQDSLLILEGKDRFQLKGRMIYNNVEITSIRTETLVLFQDSIDPLQIKKQKETLGIGTGLVVISKKQLFVSEDVYAIIRENSDYRVSKQQGIILSSHSNGAVFYDATTETPILNIYGPATVFNGLRLLEHDANDQFYSFRGGWREGSQRTLAPEEGKYYNEKLKEYYGYSPAQTVEMDINVYQSGISTPTEMYELRSGQLHDKLGSTDLYVANYLLDDSFDSVPKKKAVILWSSKGTNELTGDRSDFVKIVEAKKQQLIEQGYVEGDIEIKEFTTDDEFIKQLDTVEEATYLEVVSHGWTSNSGSYIGTEEYYDPNSYDLPEEVQDAMPVSTRDITTYFMERNKKVSNAEQKPIFSQEGAFCIISTCHSEAQKVYYDPENGLISISPDRATIPEVIKRLSNEKVIVWGTLGPLYLVGERDENGKWTKMLIPVADVTPTFEGTGNPPQEYIYTQDIGYVRVE